MTWNNLPNLAHAQQVNESHLDQIRENIEHLGSMKFGETALSALLAGTKAARLALGTYTGNGAATKAVTGVGFQPKFLLIYAATASAPPYGVWLKMSIDGTKARYIASVVYVDDAIISLDSDGFTVGDCTGIGSGLGNETNLNGTTYNYLALG